MEDSNPAVIPSSGNVFADLGLKDSEILLLKAKLAHAISQAIEASGWTQERAATELDLDQVTISATERGRLSGFSLERLLGILHALGYDVNIAVKTRDAASDARTVVQ